MPEDDLVIHIPKANIHRARDISSAPGIGPRVDEQLERALALKVISRDLKTLLREVRELRKDIGRPLRKTRVKAGSNRG